MGSKGSNTTTTNQTQTYQPNAQAAGYINNALQTAQNTAQLPFNIPQAPVAGFSNDQQTAFNTVNNAQGMAQPYINQAANYFSPQGAQSFLNPYAANVMAGLKDVFGQQATQNTGQLTQAAGGVGADRIAVGQAQLANQQGLAAGQTLSGLYGQAVQQAQGAGYGTAALGSQAQNAALSGAQAQLGTGGLQQQLAQAQLNAPYQRQLAQAAFPYQQSQFLTGAVGALAPGLGGTTSGYGTTTPPAPSMLSQILGLGTAAVGGIGASGGFGNNGWVGNALGTNAAYGNGNGEFGGSSQNPLPGLSPGDYGEGFARGGHIHNPYYDDGGGIPNDKPIDVDAHPFIPASQITPIQPHIPQLNLNPPQQSGGSGSGGSSAMGDIANVAKLAMMFAANRGGRINNPYASGGRTPPHYGDTGSPGGAVYDDPTADQGPVRLDPGAYANWQRGVSADMGSGTTATNLDGAPNGNPYALSYADTSTTPDAPAVAAIKKAASRPRPALADASGAPGAPDTTQGVNNPSQPNVDPALPDPTHPGGSDFAKSPWAALMQAGLGIAAGTSPYAAVNIGQGGQQGLKVLEQQREAANKDETVKQAAERLRMEAKHHEDQYTRMTPYQRWETTKPIPGGQVYDPNTGLTRSQYIVPDGKGGWKPVTGDGGSNIDPNTGEPVKPIHASIGDAIISGQQMPYTTGLGKVAPAVRKYLADKGFDMTKAYLEAKSAEKQIQALNGPQMQRGYQLSKSVNSTIDEVQQLSEQMKLGGIPLLNKVALQGYVNGVKGTKDQQNLAVQYTTAVNTLKEEFANLANGGYAPTEPAWKLADEQINGNYGMDKLGASLTEVKRLINYRMGFMSEGFGPGAANRYNANPGATAPAATAAPAATPPNPATLRTQAEAAIKLNPPARAQIIKHLQEQGGDATGL